MRERFQERPTRKCEKQDEAKEAALKGMVVDSSLSVVPSVSLSHWVSALPGFNHNPEAISRNGSSLAKDSFCRKGQISSQCSQQLGMGARA